MPLDTPWEKLAPAHRKLLLEGGKDFRGVIPFLERLQQKAYKAGNRFIVKRYQVPRPCADCGGKRLRPEALRVTLGGKSLAEVTARSNTLVVVEHDPMVIGAAEYLADLGPGAGELGGHLLYAGPAAGIGAVKESATAQYLAGGRRVTRTLRAGEPEGFLVV